ncbi:MAG TPA: hypothetical protein GX746_01720 [Bacteroidales bacterium]|nr:hypothetical protein [Bacteroidales bacterium]
MLFIEQLPEADSIIVIWFKLLTLAGKINNGGVLLFRDSIPYTDEMLSTIFRRPINTIRLALRTFEEFGMVEIINNAITIPNWSKHQSLDQLESKKEYMKEYMREYREKQKQLTECKVNSKTNSKANVSSLDKEEEREGDKEEDKDILSSADDSPTPYKQIVDLYNQLCTSLPKVKNVTDKRKKTLQARWKTYNDISTYEKVFQMAQASDFLSGRNGRWTSCSFDWLINENNMIKVIEGNYENKKQVLSKKTDFQKYPQHDISESELEGLFEDVGGVK